MQRKRQGSAPLSSNQPPGAGSAAGAQPRSAESVSRAAVVALPLLLVLWLWLLVAVGAFRDGPNGSTFGTDFAMFYGAAHVTAAGGNPYDTARLYGAEFGDLRARGIRVTAPRYVRVANPPLFYLALEPMTDLGFPLAAYIWLGMMATFALVGFVAEMIYLRVRTSPLPVLVFAAMPQTVFAVYYGNVDALVLAALGVGLLVSRRWPFAGGAVFSLALVKPQIGLAAVLLILLSGSDRGRVMLGFLGSAALELVVTVVTTGPSRVVDWVPAMFSFSRAAGTYSDVASLGGLYASWLDGSARLAVSAALMAAAIVLTGLWFRGHTEPGSAGLVSSSWLWPVWLLAIPFDHLHDEIVLAVPLLVLWSVQREGALARTVVAALYVLLSSVIALAVRPDRVVLLWLPLLALAVLLYRATARATIATRAAGAGQTAPEPI